MSTTVALLIGLYVVCLVFSLAFIVGARKLNHRDPT